METWRWILSVFLKAHFRSFFLSIFSLFWREIFLMGQKEKHLNSTIYFPSSPLNQTHSKKVFLPIFSSKFSILPISLPNKHTLRDFGINAWDFSELSVRFFFFYLFCQSSCCKLNWYPPNPIPHLIGHHDSFHRPH